MGHVSTVSPYGGPRILSLDGCWILRSQYSPPLPRWQNEGVIPDAPSDWPRPPLWVRWSRLPMWCVTGVMATCAVTGAIVYAVDYSGWQLLWAYAALLVGAGAGAAGFVTAFRNPPGVRWVALALAAIAPFVAAWAGIDPIIEWNLGLFAAQLLTMSGMGIWWALVPAAGAYFATVLAGKAGWMDSNALIAAVSTIAFALVGLSLTTRRLYWEQVQLRTRELAAVRDLAVARGVAEERVQIARDLHDLIGHEIAAVNLRIGAAEVHLDDSPSQTRQDLEAARGNIQTVLAETQRILTVLRSPDEDSQALADHRQIPALVDASRDSGLAVEASLPETIPDLRAETSRAAYRIVQEMLTNAAKHGTGEMSLRIDVDDGWLVIEAVNIAADEPVRDPSRHGFGLIGMRERAASVGGSLTTEVDGHLFWTRARLPLGSIPDPAPRKDNS